jgi:hypothetical protein
MLPQGTMREAMPPGDGGPTGWVPRPTPPAPRPSAWSLFPAFVLLAFLILIAADGWMTWRAMTARAAAEAASGWSVFAADKAGHVEIRLIDGAGRPLPAEIPSVAAHRPAGPEERQTLDGETQGTGCWLSVERLSFGQWDLDIRIVAAGHDVIVTRKFFVR